MSPSDSASKSLRPSPAALGRGLSAVSSHLALLGLSAVMLALAYPRPGWGWIAHVALMPMVVLALRSVTPRRLMWTSYLVSLAWWLFMIRWLTGVTVGGYIGLSAYMALYLPAALMLIRFLHQRFRPAMVLLLPVVWTSLEFTRCHFLQGGFPWFALGHSQAPFDSTDGASRLIQIADVFGQHGVSFLVAMSNGFVVDLLARPLFQGHDASRGPRGTAPRPARVVQASAILWILALGGAWLYGHYRLTSAPSSAPSLRITVVQTDVPQDNKAPSTAPRSIIDDWHRMVDLTVTHFSQQAHPPDLIVWPETMVQAGLNRQAVEFYSTTDSILAGREKFDKSLRQLAHQLGVNLMVGAAFADDFKDLELPGGRIVPMPRVRCNSAYLYRADGSQAPQRYDKVRRVPFGEYIPWVENVPWLKRLFIQYLSPYKFDYTLTPGTELTVFDVPMGQAPIEGDDRSAPMLRVAAPICFEDAAPMVTRGMVYDAAGSKRADLLVNLTNDGWYPGTDQGPQQLQIAVFRCVECRVPMARSVNRGISGFIDSMGRVGPLVEVRGRQQMVEGALTHDVQADERLAPFGRIGHMPIYAMMLGLMGWIIFGLARARGGRR